MVGLHASFATWLSLATLLLVTASAPAAAQPAAGAWLDRALTNWNGAGQALPRAPGGDEATAAVIARCKLTPPQATAAERALADTGWIPFWNVDQQLVREGVEVVGGMRAADGMCRPALYNLFVFVGGRFAGTLSPQLMSSRLDAASGAVRLAPPRVSAEFSRYMPTDPLCCPSSRVTVRYQIEPTSEGPLVVPVEIRTTRP